jgi:hypothetical protein
MASTIGRNLVKMEGRARHSVSAATAGLIANVATDYFLRFWSPWSPSPFLTTAVALMRRSAAKERPTSSLS